MSDDLDQIAQSLGVIQEVASLLACPYSQGTGTCLTGCRTEPSCLTDMPSVEDMLDALVDVVTGLDDQFPRSNFSTLFRIRLDNRLAGRPEMSKADIQLEAHNDGLPCGFGDCQLCNTVPLFGAWRSR